MQYFVILSASIALLVASLTTALPDKFQPLANTDTACQAVSQLCVSHQRGSVL
jgi:hypothetical protein